MTQPIAVVTGANGGIGYATAAALARRGMHVVLACRSEACGEAAHQAMVAQTGSRAVEVLPLDLASLDSVRHFAETFTARHPRLAGTGVTAYSLHPGVIGTNLAGELPAGLAGLMQRVLPGAEQGAATSIYVVTAPGLESFSGQYFAYRTLLRRHSRGPRWMARHAIKPARAIRLWQVSEQLCGITTAASQTLSAPHGRTTPPATVSVTR